MPSLSGRCDRLMIYTRGGAVLAGHAACKLPCLGAHSQRTEVQAPAALACEQHASQYLREQQLLAQRLLGVFVSGRLPVGAAAGLREFCPGVRFFSVGVATLSSGSGCLVSTGNVLAGMSKLALLPLADATAGLPLLQNRWLHMARAAMLSRYGDLEEAWAEGAESVLFAPVPCPGPARPGVQGGACAVLTLGIEADKDIYAPPLARLLLLLLASRDCRGHARLLLGETGAAALAIWQAGAAAGLARRLGAHFACADEVQLLLVNLVLVLALEALHTCDQLAARRQSLSLLPPASLNYACCRCCSCAARRAGCWALRQRWRRCAWLEVGSGIA
ncbi:hypothetical protein WJX81_003852 [Elliptochloris bilobata]|uniref:Uncharacterized protein n=1 Tax=Elliptochloris bilobata TaxID=381761 RepID=A0AAW1SJJ4_9CHLO